MTQVYTSNLDSVTNNTLPPGWTAVSGAFVAQTAANGARPVSGTQASLTQASEGNVALYTGAGALASEDWQSSHVVYISGGDIAINHHLLRSDLSFANCYRLAIVYSGGNYTAVLIKRVGGGNTNLGAGSGTPTPLAVTNGDKVLMATTISGSTINLYMWKQGGSRPATPNYTWTDSAISAAGYPGFYAALGTQASAPSSDDFVLDDMQATATAAALAGNAIAQVTATGSLVGTIPAAVLAGSSIAQVTATGSLSGTASFTFDVMINNANSLYKNQAVVWSWHQAGRIGQASASVTYGTGTINASGLVTATGLPAGAGFGLVAARNTSALDDAVYYQAGTAA